MATYFHHHHPHHHNQQGSNNSDDGALQTLILMNPNFVGYSDAQQQQQPPQSSSPSNFLFHAPTLYHAPPPLLPQLVGVPLHSPNSPYAPPQPSHAQHYAAWAQLGSMPPERESPRAQQGLSLTLSSHNNNHSYTVSGHGQPEQLQPSPGIDAGSESPAPSSAGDVHGAAALMTSSKYLKAAQELLEEVVNVNVDRAKPESLAKKSKGNKSESSPSAVAGEGPKEEYTAAELTASDKQELQMKKAKLITLLDEVDQRHRQYQHQMQAVVASFEQVAGANSARTYTSLALKTISSQFRCLRGAISGQIKAANKGLGEGEGEGGSRLKFLDHHMRQQRALQQLGMIQNNAWRPQRGLPEKAVSVLRAWLFEHFLHPYPKDSDKVMLAKQTGLTRSQVSNWFINARVRLWKPMIEEMYAEEVKEHEQNGSEGKSNKQEQHSEHGSRSVTDEKDHTYGDDQAKAAENHSSSIVIPGSTASLPPFKANVENPFALVGSSKMDGDSQGSLKKQRNNEMLSAFPDVELFNNGTKEEIQNKYVREKQEDCSMIPGSANSGFIGGLLSYPIGEMGRFGDGQFPASFSGNGVSLTLGLESLSMPGNNQAFLPNNQDIDQYRGRLEIGELSGFGGVKAPNASHSGNAYSAQLLHDFVA